MHNKPSTEDVFTTKMRTVHGASHRHCQHTTRTAAEKVIDTGVQRDQNNAK